jgi:3-hydroxyisobutyrate dehydrogenase-like beta-hydroxyacid dehydrogenase
METICVLHPGEMGAAVGAAARAQGARVLWAGTGRGEATGKRARDAGLEDIKTLAAGVGAADIVLSVCPPHAALTVAESVAALRFRGVYLDANAVSPSTTRQIGAVVEAAGATFVDGGIIGPPPAGDASTRLYLAGSMATRIADLFAGTALTPIVLDAPIGAASAVKACYAAWTKGTIALLLTIHAQAQHEGVGAALAEEWRLSQPDLFKRLDRAVNNTRKAWRWVGEMEEIGATFANAKLPHGFHLAAADVFRQLEPFKDDASATLQDIVAALLRQSKQTKP